MELPKYWYIKVTKEVKPILQQTELSFGKNYNYTIGGYYSNGGRGRKDPTEFRGGYVEIFKQDLENYLNPNNNYEIY
jgi:hypothetical protein